MKDFFLDLKDMCSASNTKSRGFYIGITIVMTLVLLIALACIGIFIYGCVIGKVNILMLIISIIAIIIDVAVCIVLSKQ